jgi:type VI secretion system Hcp family effector
MKRFFTISLAALFVLAALPAPAALNAYLVLKGSKTAKFNPDTTQGIMVIAVSHELVARLGIVSPRDVATGQATGKRVHKPLVITKELDKATPLLLRSMQSKEPITEATLYLFKPAANGKVQIFMKAVLTDVLISRYVRKAGGDPHLGGMDDPHMESFTLSFANAKTSRMNKIQGMNDWKTAGAPY